MKAEDNKFLAEQMGLCWHEYAPTSQLWSVLPSFGRGSGPQHLRQDWCIKCEEYANANPDFSTDSGFVQALLFAQDDSGHEGWTWGEFELWARYFWAHKHEGEKRFAYDNATSEYTRWLFTPSTFAGVLVEFLIGREGK